MSMPSTLCTLGPRMDQLHAYVGQELAPREGSTQEAPKHGIKEVARALRALLVQRLVERAPSCTEPTPKPQVRSVAWCLVSRTTRVCVYDGIQRALHATHP